MERSAYWLRYHFSIHGLIDGSGERLQISMERNLMVPPCKERFRIALPSEKYHQLVDIVAEQTYSRFYGNEREHRRHTRSLVAFVRPFVTERSDLLECV